MDKISFSQANMFQECPRKWAYKYIDQLPEPKSPAQEHGTHVHERIEDYLKTGNMLALDKFVYYAKNILASLGLKKYGKDYQVEEWLQDDQVRGKVDVIGHYADQKIIVDWKTKKKPAKFMNPKTISQLHLYGCLADAKDGDLLVECYPEQAKTYEIAYVSDMGKREYDRLIGIKFNAEMVVLNCDSADDVKATPGEFECTFCPFLKHCDSSYEIMKKQLKR